MANQAIALQARAPQNDFMGRAIQQNAQMINMMSQQRAAERQAAVAQQEMELARAAEGRAVTKAELEARKANQEYVASRVKYFNDQLPSVKDDAGWNNWLNRVAREDSEYADELRRMSGGRYDPGFVKRVSMDAKAFIEYTTTKPEVEVQVQPGTGVLQEVRTGGIEGISPRGAFELPEYEIDPNAGKPSAAPQSAFPATAARATDAQIDEAARKILNGAGIAELGIGPEDYDRATERANQITAGGGARMQPVSMTTAPQMGGQPDMTAVVQDMMSSKQISQSNLQLMREMAGPDKDQQLAQILRSNGIQIVPDAQPGMRSAVFRPGQDAAPQMQLAQSMEGYRPTGRAARGRDPMQSPSQAPGAAGAVSGATTAASEGVRVQTQPKIVAGEERVRRVEKLRGELPLARSETQTLVDNLDRRIDAIDRFLRNPYRSSIIGAIEGRIPRMLQTPTRADVQALYDTIVSNTVLNKLIEDRQATETGASPQGIVSDRDLAVAAQASNSLTQTGTERQQEIEMQRLRNILYQTRQRALEKYNTVYREVLSEAPELRLQVPSIAPKYTKQPTKPAAQRGGISPDVAKKYGL